VEPRNADAVTELQGLARRAERVDGTDDLVAGHDREARQREVTLDDVEIGPAARTHGDAYAHLAGSGFGTWSLDRLERTGHDRSGTRKLLCAHRVTVLGSGHDEGGLTLDRGAT
jgi:hypothetical protein